MTPQSIKIHPQNEPEVQQPHTQKHPPFGKLLISCIIIGTVTTQAYTALLRMACNSKYIPVFCDVPTDPSLYPFLDYPMYSTIRQKGAMVVGNELIAIFADGTEKNLTPEDFGLSLYWFNSRLLPAFGDQNISEIAAYITDYETAGNQPFVAVRVKNNLYVVEQEGIIPVTPEEFTITLPLAEPKQ